MTDITTKLSLLSIEFNNSKEEQSDPKKIAQHNFTEKNEKATVHITNGKTFNDNTNESNDWSSYVHDAAKYSALALGVTGAAYLVGPSLVAALSGLAYSNTTMTPVANIALAGLTFVIKNPFAALQWSAIGYKTLKGEPLPFIGGKEDNEECGPPHQDAQNATPNEGTIYITLTPEITSELEYEYT
jgi:hypothetical protein